MAAQPNINLAPAVHPRQMQEQDLFGPFSAAWPWLAQVEDELAGKRSRKKLGALSAK